MQKTEMKTDCKVLKDGQRLDAMLHLIEIRYNERITFWNGVLEMTKDNFARLGQVSHMPVGIELPEGRTGFLHLTHGAASSSDNPTREGYYLLAGVGKPNPLR